MTRSEQIRTKIRNEKQTESKSKQSSSLKIKKMDTAFLIIILILLTFGTVMVFSASYAAALRKMENSLHFITKHVAFLISGLIIMYVVSFIDYRIYRRFAYWIFGFAFLLLVAVPFIGTDLGTIAKRWIAIGPITFQPSEIMKFAIIVLFAHFITKNYKRMGTFKYGVLPFGICLLGVAGLMMIQPHLSGTILIFLIAFVMMFVGGTKLRYFATLIPFAGVGIVGIIALKGADYIVNRLQYWLDPFADTSGHTWQIVNSLVAIGSGGIMGRGLGMSRQKYHYLPEAYNDFIFAVICEELGLIGALFVIVLFILFALRGFSIASKAPDKFGFMLGIGLTAQVCIQAILNIAVVTNTIPNTGISLPFFSYGGTALMMILAQMGILLNISRQGTLDKT